MPQLGRALPLASLDSMLYDTVTRAAVTMFAAATERSVPQGVAVRYRLWLPWHCPASTVSLAVLGHRGADLIEQVNQILRSGTPTCHCNSQ